MANTALMALQSLGRMDEQAKAEQANLAKLQAARKDFKFSPADDAGFDGGGALLAGAGAAAVAGPVGLLAGLAYGIMSKKERQRGIDKFNDHNQLMDESEGIIFGQLDKAYLEAQNDFDRAIVENFQDDLALYMGMATSADEVTKRHGMNGIAQVGADLNSYLATNEQQYREDVRNGTVDMRTEHNSLLDNFRSDSSNFNAQIATADNVIEALNRGDGASVTAALATMPLLVNPDAGATTEAEVEIWKEVGGMIDSLQGTIEKELRDGGGLSDPTRKEIIEVTRQYKRNAVSWQQAREARYGKILVNRGISEKFWSEYNLSGSVPEVQEYGFIPRDKETKTIEDVIANAVSEYTEIPGLLGTDSRTPEQKKADLEKHGRFGRD